MVDPLQTLRIVMDETDGVAVDLTWEALFPVVQEQRHLMRAGARVTLDAQRFAQLGAVAGRGSTSTASTSPSTRGGGSAPETGPGASGRSASPNRPDARPTRHSKACGGCM